MPTLLISLIKDYWPQIIAFVGAVALGFWMAWQLQGLRLDALEIDFGKYRNQVEQQAIEARQAALKQQAAWLQEKEHALKVAQEREQKLQKDVAAAQSAVGGLRNTIAALRAQLPGSSQPACAATADAGLAVLSECADRYRAMAEVADGHRNDAQTLIEAWPQ